MRCRHCSRRRRPSRPPPGRGRSCGRSPSSIGFCRPAPVRGSAGHAHRRGDRRGRPHEAATSHRVGSDRHRDPRRLRGRLAVLRADAARVGASQRPRTGHRHHPRQPSRGDLVPDDGGIGGRNRRHFFEVRHDGDVGPVCRRGASRSIGCYTSTVGGYWSTATRGWTRRCRTATVPARSRSTGRRRPSAPWMCPRPLSASPTCYRDT